MNIDTTTPYSFIDLKLLYNELLNNKSKKLLCPTLSQIKQLLASYGYKLTSKQYYNSNRRHMSTYYIIISIA